MIVNINVWRVLPDGNVQEFVKAWTTRRALLRAQPGAFDAHLYSREDNPNVFVGIAGWASAEYRNTALEHVRSWYPVLEAHYRSTAESMGSFVLPKQLASSLSDAKGYVDQFGPLLVL